jgi:D-sedoheptulose 7-phosphate isomerase
VTSMTSAPVEADELQARVAEGLAAAIALTEAASRSCGEALVRAARTVADSLSRGGKLLIAGNGGNAADAQHLAAEFVGKLVNDRRPLAAVALTTDTSALTAIGNDYGFEQVFARQVAALGRPGDVLLALSTSGRSPNVVAAAEYARQAGISTVALTGGGASPLRAGCDEAIVIPSRVTARIQECQLTLEHLLAECVEALLVPETAPPLTEPARSTRTLTPWPELLVERSGWDDAGRVVVWTSGCFDILHVGHLRSLQMAKEFGDILVVGLNDDESVRHLKGDDRPITPLPERADLVAALGLVDRVVAFPEDSPERAIGALKPDVVCKGADYSPGGKPMPEREVVRSYGGRVEILPLVASRSTSRIAQLIAEGA